MEQQKFFFESFVNDYSKTRHEHRNNIPNENYKIFKSFKGQLL